MVKTKMQVNPCRDNLQEFKANQSESTDSEDSDGPVGKTLKEYGGATTIHGIPYILEDGRKMFERLLWVSLVILGMVLTIHLSAQLYNDWQDDPVLTTVGTTGLDIEKIDYPSITICAQGSVKEMIDSAVFHQFTEYLEEKQSKQETKSMRSINKRDTKEDSTDDIQNQMEEFLRDTYPGMKRMPNELIELMTSPDPEKTMNIKANLNPEDEKCKPSEDHIQETNGNEAKETNLSSEYDEFGCPDVEYNGGACKNSGTCPNNGWVQHTGTGRRKCFGFHKATLSTVCAENGCNFDQGEGAGDVVGFHGAMSKCQDFGGDLVMFNYPDQAKQFEEVLGTNLLEPGHRFFLGATRHMQDDNKEFYYDSKFYDFGAESQRNRSHKDTYTGPSLSSLPPNTPGVDEYGYVVYNNESQKFIDHWYNKDQYGSHCLKACANGDGSKLELLTSTCMKYLDYKIQLYICERTPENGGTTPECKDGYVRVMGGVSSPGAVGTEAPVISSEKCGEKCDANPSCNSYGYEPKMRKCSLNKEENSNVSNEDEDYYFCVKGYQLFVNGGCATENNKYPQWERRQFGPDQEGSCHQYCVETQGCKYFEFEHKTGRCELHNQEITKSNGYPGVKCYKMVSGTAVGRGTEMLPKMPCFKSSTQRKKRHTNEPNQDQTSLQCDNHKPTPPGIEKLSRMLDPTESENRQDATETARKKYNEDFGLLNLNNQTVYLKLFQIFWYSQLPCFDIRNITSVEKGTNSILKRCYWKGELVSCKAVFKTQPTDRGMCCTFNMDAAEKIYKDSTYLKAISTMQTQDLDLAFQSDDENEEVKDLKPKAGLKSGLTIMLDLHSDLISTGTIFDDYRGFTVSINSPREFPITSESPILIKPGQMNTVGITAVKVQASDDIRVYAPDKRKCYFADEIQLKLFKKYSRNNCILECNLEYASQTLTSSNTNFTACIPWFYPFEIGLEIKMCDPWEQRVFQDLMGTVPEEYCQRCLPDCEATIYDARVSMAAFKKCGHTNLGASQFCDLEKGGPNPAIWAHEARNEFQIKMGNVPYYLMRNAQNQTKLSNIRFYVPNKEKRRNLVFQEELSQQPSYNAYDHDIAMVNFFFERKEAFQFNRKSANTWTNYISQIGGNTGLTIGFSMISLAELIYWGTIRLWQNFKDKKVKQGKEKGQDTSGEY